MNLKEAAIRVVRTESFKTERRPIEALLEVMDSHSEYKVPLDAGKRANTFQHTLTNTPSRSPLGSCPYIGKGNECTSDLTPSSVNLPQQDYAVDH